MHHEKEIRAGQVIFMHQAKTPFFIGWMKGPFCWDLGSKIGSWNRITDSSILIQEIGECE